MNREESVAFGPLQIRFDDRVLRPRQWTQAQSRWGTELLASSPDGPILDLCTGAGHLGLLAAYASERQVVLVDRDPIACHYARLNAVHAGMYERTEVRCGSMTDVLGDHENFALILADPPWVPSAEIGRYPEDPVTAIDGGPDGLNLLRACLTVINRHLAPGGHAVIQAGSREQIERVSSERCDEPSTRLELVGVRDEERGALMHVRADALSTQAIDVTPRIPA